MCYDFIDRGPQINLFSPQQGKVAEHSTWLASQQRSKAVELAPQLEGCVNVICCICGIKIASRSRGIMPISTHTKLSTSPRSDGVNDVSHTICAQCAHEVRKR